MKAVNLEEILKSYLTIEAMMANNPNYTFNMVLSAMKEACRQTLELAAENANVSVFDYIDKDFKEFGQNKNVYIINDGTYVQIDKQSILDTINQIQ